MQGKRKFRKLEIEKLTEILHLTAGEKDEIFPQAAWKEWKEMTEAERLRNERRQAQKRQEHKALMVGILMEMMTFILFTAASGILK